MTVSLVIRGLATFVPGLRRIFRRGTGGTTSASYSYAVWLKHLTMLWENGMRSVPNTLAELGPGDSLGVGLAAMLSGVNNYYALDVVRYSNTELNLKIFEELVALFKARAERPSKGWPDCDRYLDAQLFPSHILTEEVLERSLSDKRIGQIRSALLNSGSQTSGVTVRYMVPWSDSGVIAKESVDVVLSHSVLEHVVDLEATYRSLHLWLRPRGLMSHQIDFESHGLSEKWNGYRTYSELLWKVILGKRPFLINRQPYSVHAELIKKSGFNLICELKRRRADGIPRSELSAKWSDISDDDLNCSGAFVQAHKQ